MVLYAIDAECGFTGVSWTFFWFQLLVLKALQRSARLFEMFLLLFRIAKPEALQRSAGMLSLVSIVLVSACDAEGALEERRIALMVSMILICSCKITPQCSKWSEKLGLVPDCVTGGALEERRNALIGQHSFGFGVVSRRRSRRTPECFVWWALLWFWHILFWWRYGRAPECLDQEQDCSGFGLYDKSAMTESRSMQKSWL